MVKNNRKLREIKRLREIREWLRDIYQVTHFISLQLPFDVKTDDFDVAMHHIWLITKWAEKNLLKRHWVSKYYRFAGFAERGRDGTWHAHLLLSCPDRSTQEIVAAFACAGEKYRKDRRTNDIPDIDIRKITGLKRLVRYCTKQLGLDYLTRIDTDRIFISEDLFNRQSSRR